MFAKMWTRNLALVLPIFALGAAVRLLWIGRENLWYDELYTIWSSRLPLGSLIPEIVASRHLPVYFVLGHFWFSVETGDTWVRLISWAAGSATILVTYLVARELFPRKTALLSAALVAFSPLLIAYSRDATYYSWVTFASLLSFYLLVRAMRTNRPRDWAIYVALTTLAVFSYSYSPLFLIASAIFFLMERGRGRLPRPWIVSQGVFLAETALMGILTLTLTANGLMRSAGLAIFGDKMAHGLFYLPMNLLAGPTEGFTTRRFRLLVLFLLILLALFALTRMRIHKRPHVTALAVYSAILFTGPVVLYSTLADTTEPYRFFVWAGPTFLMLLAAFITDLRGRGCWILGSCCLAILLCFSYPLLRNHNWEKRDMSEVFAVVSDEHRDGDVLMCFPARPFAIGADHYLPGYPVTGGIIDPKNPDLVRMAPSGPVWPGYSSRQDEGREDLTGEELAERLIDDLKGAGRLWVVSGSGEFEAIPPADCVEEILAKEWRQERDWAIPPYTLKLYSRKQGSA